MRTSGLRVRAPVVRWSPAVIKIMKRQTAWVKMLLSVHIELCLALDDILAS